tara:strand:- start:3016 stop:3954 length:939 start_codon:yes stop_codon:yes gene_type:complete
MAKKDDITLIIAKAFAKERFTKEETTISRDFTISSLVTEYGLNDIQAKEVMKWCTISCAALPLETSLLEENFLGKLFQRNKKRNTRSQQQIDSLVKNQIEVTSDFDDNAMCSFLNKLNNFKNKIELQGLHREERAPTRKAKDHGDLIDKAIDKTPFIYNKEISPNYLRGLTQLLNKTKSLYTALDRMPLPQVAKNESYEPFALSAKDLNRRKPATEQQVSDLVHLVNNDMYKNAIGKPTEHIKRQVLVKNFIDFMNRLVKPVNNEEKIRIIFSAKKYIRELHNEIFKIVKNESELSIHSHEPPPPRKDNSPT